MKRFLLCLLSILPILYGFCQDASISLTFSAKDSLNQNALALDSVRIQNLTQNCDTTLFDSVSVLTIIPHWPVGIKEPPPAGGESFILMQNSPNPFHGNTLVRIFIKNKSRLTLSLFNNLGEILSEYSNEFEKGWQVFSVSTGGSQISFLKVSDNISVKTIKMFGDGTGNTSGRVSYTGPSYQGDIKVKSFPEANWFVFYLGDSLKYTAYVNGYHDGILTDKPISSKAYTFAMLSLTPPVPPSVITSPVSDTAQRTATCGGYVGSDGGATVSARGVCWSLVPLPTTADSLTSDGSGTGTFVSFLSGLTPDTIYYVRAYATNIAGTAYGAQLSFMTLVLATPAVTTAPLSEITQTTVICGGHISSDGGEPVTARGVCWSLISGPTIADSLTQDGTDTGVFVSNVTGLVPDSTYYIRAYATNSLGTSYGGELTFTTPPAGIPTLHTSPVTDISYLTAKSGGTVVSDGGAPVSARGVCWGTSPQPTPGGSHTTDGSGTGTFTSDISGLSPDTYYYIRAYATNSFGTAYGEELSFTTLQLSIPALSTAAVTDITRLTATSGGDITSDGGVAVTERGVCWNTMPNPTTSDSHTTDGAGTGTFVSNLTGLTPFTIYYIRAYATNSLGTAYGNELSFTTAFACGDIVTYGGQVYNTIQIGTQCWFKENLNVGIMISIPTPQTNNGVLEKYCYGNDASNCAIYGGLYQWNEMMQYTTAPGVQGICPAGWHLPTDSEYSTLVGSLGGEAVAGGAMKETGTSHWAPPNGGATNSSGFTALPAGCSYSTSMFQHLHNLNFLWSSTLVGAGAAWRYVLTSANAGITREDMDKSFAQSVRCVKD